MLQGRGNLIMKRNLKTLLLTFLGNIFILALSLFYNLVLFEGGHVGDCLFYRAFGFYCPGCGGSRSLAALLSFKFIRSFVFYPPLLIAAFYVLVFDIKVLVATVKKIPFKANKLLASSPFVIMGAVVIHFILRLALLKIFDIDLIQIAGSIYF
jgi:hypothetical protein